MSGVRAPTLSGHCHEMHKFFMDFAGRAFQISGGWGGAQLPWYWLEDYCLTFCSFVTSLNRLRNPAREA